MAVATKDEAYRQWLQRKTRASLEEYIIKRREASKLCRQKKRRFDRKNMEGLKDRNEVRREQSF